MYIKYTAMDTGRTAIREVKEIKMEYEPGVYLLIDSSGEYWEIMLEMVLDRLGVTSERENCVNDNFIDCRTIAGYETEEEANAALDRIFEAMANGARVYDLTKDG